MFNMIFFVLRMQLCENLDLVRFNFVHFVILWSSQIPKNRKVYSTGLHHLISFQYCDDFWFIVKNKQNFQIAPSN